MASNERAETLAKLQEIEQRWAKATPGPWTADTEAPGDCVIWAPAPAGEPDEMIVMNMGTAIVEVGHPCVDEAENCHAIATARDDVPWLCAQLRAVLGEEGRRDVR